jgi:hypothetical protein
MPFVGLTTYNNSETTRIEFCIRDTAESSQASSNNVSDKKPDFIFKSVTFENGVAVAKWDDAFEVGSITITGIPGFYRNGQGSINLSLSFQKGSGQDIYHYSIADTRDIVDATTWKAKFYRDKEAEYIPYNGTTNITLVLVGPADSPRFLFEAVQITDDKATLDFARGFKQ